MVIIGGHSSLLDRCKMAEAPPAALAKLAVLATAAVDPRLPAPRVARRLAGDAGAAAGQGLAPRLRNPLAAILAIIGAFALGEAEARQFDGVGHRVVDLFLHGAVARPAIGQIGRAHVCTPVTNAHLVCRLLLEQKNTYKLQSTM